MLRGLLDTMKILTINDENFSDVVKDVDLPLVIKFYSPTCHLCTGIKPVYEKVAKMYSDDYVFCEVNTTKSRKLTKFFKIDGVPQIFVVTNDKRTEIPYPEKSDPETGYSIYDIADFLDTYQK